MCRVLSRGCVLSIVSGIGSGVVSGVVHLLPRSIHICPVAVLCVMLSWWAVARLIVQVTMLRNAALDAGAVDLDSGSACAIKGVNVFSQNAADRDGGAFTLAGAVVRVEASAVLCASGNTAAGSGGFAALLFSGNQFVFVSGSQVKLGDNTQSSGSADTFYLDTLGAGSPQPQIKCGGDSATPWAFTNGGTYTITGTDVCACNSAFVAGTSTTCDTCGAPGWDQAACACVVSVCH